MSTYFVSAAGTDVGKTFVTSLLIRQLRAAGRRVRAIKPVISGFDEAAPDGSDSALLLEALGRDATKEAIAEISPWRYAAPLAPNMAAQLEGEVVDFSGIIDFCRGAVQGNSDDLFIEGVGGVMAPISNDELMIDWMAAIGAPVILVTGSYLGAISHTLTAAAALKNKGLTLSSIVVSQSLDGVDLGETRTNLVRFSADVPVISIPRIPDKDDWRGLPDITGILI